MAGLSYLRRGQALFMISALEYVTPLVRMLLLSRFLDLRELGFGSALLASYGLFEQVSDMALYRFVMTTKREEFDEALACAHGMSLLRGAAVCLVGALAAPLIAANFSLSAYWGDFALLGVLVFVRSFENFAPRVAERDFHFAAQLKMGVAANVASLLVLVGMLEITHDHRALLASLFALMLGSVVASHFFSETPYRISFRSRLFPQAYKFGFPLMLNGIGLALSSQGDRFLVGAMLGLPTLGVYTLISTVVILPTNMIWRLAGGVNTALFFNAMDAGKDLGRRVAMAGHLSAIVGATYAVGVALLLNIVVPLVFGARFVMTQEAAMILAFAAYARIMRGEPFNSLLMLERRTKRLALVNLAVAAGLLVSAALMHYFPTIESALAARLTGECFGLICAVYFTRNLLHGGLGEFGLSIMVGLLLTGSICGVLYLEDARNGSLASLVAGLCYIPALSAWTFIALGPVLRERWKAWRGMAT